MSKENNLGNFESTIKNLPCKQAGSTPQAVATEGRPLDNLKKQYAEGGFTPTPLQLVDGSELDQLPNPETLVEYDGKALLLKGCLNAVIGAPKSGKSTLLAWIIATLTKQGRKVLVVDTEQGKQGLKYTRWRCGANGGDVKNLSLVDGLALRGGGAGAVLSIAEAVQSTNADVLIIDNYRHLISDEKGTTEAQEVNTALKALKEQNGTTILAVIHTSRSTGHASAYGMIGAELEREFEHCVKVECEEGSSVRKVKHYAEGTRYVQAQEIGFFTVEEMPTNIQGTIIDHVPALKWSDGLPIDSAGVNRVREFLKNRRGAAFTMSEYRNLVQCSESTAKRDLTAAAQVGIIKAPEASTRGAKYTIVATSEDSEKDSEE